MSREDVQTLQSWGFAKECGSLQFRLVGWVLDLRLGLTRLWFQHILAGVLVALMLETFHPVPTGRESFPIAGLLRCLRRGVVSDSTLTPDECQYIWLTDRLDYIEWGRCGFLLWMLTTDLSYFIPTFAFHKDRLELFYPSLCFKIFIILFTSNRVTEGEKETCHQQVHFSNARLARAKPEARSSILTSTWVARIRICEPLSSASQGVSARSWTGSRVSRT